jgi:hypothetical protein
MAVIYGSPDLLPSLSVVYACDCGACLGEYGTHAGDPPPGWVRVAEGLYLCEHCAASAKEVATS